MGCLQAAIIQPREQHALKRGQRDPFPAWKLVSRRGGSLHAALVLLLQGSPVQVKWFRIVFWKRLLHSIRNICLTQFALKWWLCAHYFSKSRTTALLHKTHMYDGEHETFQFGTIWRQTKAELLAGIALLVLRAEPWLRGTRGRWAEARGTLQWAVCSLRAKRWIHSHRCMTVMNIWWDFSPFHAHPAGSRMQFACCWLLFCTQWSVCFELSKTSELPGLPLKGAVLEVAGLGGKGCMKSAGSEGADSSQQSLRSLAVSAQAHVAR